MAHLKNCKYCNKVFEDNFNYAVDDGNKFVFCSPDCLTRFYYEIGRELFE